MSRMNSQNSCVKTAFRFRVPFADSNFKVNSFLFILRTVGHVHTGREFHAFVLAIGILAITQNIRYVLHKVILRSYLGQIIDQFSSKCHGVSNQHE